MVRVQLCLETAMRSTFEDTIRELVQTHLKNFRQDLVSYMKRFFDANYLLARSRFYRLYILTKFNDTLQQLHAEQDKSRKLTNQLTERGKTLNKMTERVNTTNQKNKDMYDNYMRLRPKRDKAMQTDGPSFVRNMYHGALRFGVGGERRHDGARAWDQPLPGLAGVEKTPERGGGIAMAPSEQADTTFWEKFQIIGGFNMHVCRRTQHHSRLFFPLCCHMIIRRP